MTIDVYVDGSATECHETATALRTLRDACDLAGNTLAEDLLRVAAGWTGDAAEACTTRIHALLVTAERLAVSSHHLAAEIEALGGALVEVTAGLREADAVADPERATALAARARHREATAQNAWLAALSELDGLDLSGLDIDHVEAATAAGVTLGLGGLVAGAARPRPAVVKEPPGWSRQPQPARGASEVLVPRLRPTSGVLPSLVLTSTPGTVPPPLPADLRGAGVRVEDEDHYETELGPVDYVRVGWTDETHGEMVAEVWTWTRDDVVWRLVGCTALEDFPEFTDVFEEVADDFRPDGR